MRKSIIVPLALAAVAGLGLSGCSGPGSGNTTEEQSKPEAAADTDGEPLVIGITVADLANPYYVSVTEGMKAECEAAGCTVEVHDGKQDTLGQISAVENFVTKGVGAIVVAANADGALDGAAAQAKEAGIPVVALAQATNGSDAFIRLSELEAGAVIGQIAADWINENLASPADAKVLVIGDKTVTNTAQRMEGIKQGIEEGAAGAVIVAEAPATSAETALAATENALTANPGINVVVAANDDTALGAYEAMAAAGKKPGEAAVIGFDATLEAIKKIEEGGVFVGTVSVDATKQGALLVETVQRVLKEGSIGDIYVPFDPVTPSNVADYK